MQLPTVQTSVQIWEDCKTTSPLLGAMGAFHFIAILSMAFYFSNNNQTAQEPASFKNDEADKNSSDSTTDSKTFHEDLEVSKHDFTAFTAAARRVGNPLYVILPAVFVTWLTGLNALSSHMLRIPHLRTLWDRTYRGMAKEFGDPRWIRDFTLDARPLVLTWLCLVPPVMLSFMIFNSCRTMLAPFTARSKKSSNDSVYGLERVHLRQMVDHRNDQRVKSFYESAWFTPATLVPFILGLPMLVSMWIYYHLGVDALLGFPSRDPHFHTTFVIITLYLYSLGACLSALFFRSYFTFCWNFDSLEYEIELYQDMIKRLPIKGWFYDFMMLSARQQPIQILWKDVTAVKFSSGKLKFDASQREHPALIFLRKVTSLFENVAEKLDLHSEYLEIVGQSGQNIHIRLWELTAQEKLQVFKHLREHAPSVYLTESVQEALIGSAVLSEPKYTEIWFSVLSDGLNNYRDGELSKGQILKNGQYEVVSTLASGGQAVLYEATAEGQKVVLKEFQLTSGESIDAKIESTREFENESSILSQLSHPAIVQLLDMFYDEGRVYLVLEYVEGQSLRQKVSQEGSLKAEEILSLAKQMAEILQYLHRMTPSIVHRDFTPDNIILQPDGKLKLIDFNVAQSKKDGMVSDCAGKHAYTPPEQFGGQACPQSDLYALGATLYFLATGNDPVPITESSLPGSNEDQPWKSLTQIIERCTRLELSERIESADWLLTELKTFGDSVNDTKHDTIAEPSETDTGAVIRIEDIEKVAIELDERES